MLGTEFQWRLSSREAEWLEAMASATSGVKTDFLTHVFSLASWTTEDYMLAVAAGLRFYNKGTKPEDVFMSVTETIEFRILFAEWVSTLIPDDLKKKADDLRQRSLAPKPANTQYFCHPAWV